VKVNSTETEEECVDEMMIKPSITFCYKLHLDFSKQKNGEIGKH